METKKYTGNFGVLTLQIDGDKVSGAYGEEGTLEGTLSGDNFRGTWTNKGDSGLIQFNLSNNQLEGSWKKGMDDGPMKGKWSGTTENQSTDNVHTHFMDKFKGLGFSSIYNFISESDNLLKLIQESGSKNPESEACKIYDVLYEFTETNQDKLVGLLFIFSKIAERYDIYLDFEYSWLDDYAYSLDELTENDHNLVGLICEQFGESQFSENDFKYVFTTKFICTLTSLVDEIDGEDLAEFIVSCNQDQYTLRDNDEWGSDWIADMSLDILKSIGYDICDFEGECTIYPNYFLASSYEMGYDYIALGESICSDYA